MQHQDLLTPQAFAMYRAFAETHSYCGPFVPYIGDEYGKGTFPKFVYCGVAARWDSHFVEEADAQHSSAAFSEGVVAANLSSAFWRLCSDTLDLLDPEGRLTSAQKRRAMVWTNVSKLGVAGETAPPDSDRELRDLDTKQLKHEINVLAPDLLLCVSGSKLISTAKVAFADLPDADFAAAHNDTVVKRLVDGGWLYWTMHPQFKSGQWQNGVMADLKNIVSQLGPIEA